MSERPRLDDFESQVQTLASMSKRFGSDILFVQGAGGNTSLKVDDQKMLVKASGGRLDAVTQTSGWVVVDYRKIRTSLECSTAVGPGYESRLDDDLVTLVDASTVNKCHASAKASIEAAMHTLFERYAVHVHPLEVNAILTAVTSRQMIHEIFSDLDNMYVGLTPPGFYLAREIQTLKSRVGRLAEVLFLESHGIIVHGPSLARVEVLLELIVERVVRFLDLRLSPRIHYAELEDLRFESSQPDIFPDTIVFKKVIDQLDTLAEEKRRSVIETYSAARYMRMVHAQLGLSGRVLSDDLSTYIVNMGREKHRQQVMLTR